MASHSITYDLTDAQLAEMLLALDYHRNGQDPATEADLKAFGLIDLWQT